MTTRLPCLCSKAHVHVRFLKTATFKQVALRSLFNNSSGCRLKRRHIRVPCSQRPATPASRWVLPDTSLQFYARLTGAAYILVITLGMLGQILVDPELLVSSNQTQLNEGLFRAGVAIDLAMFCAVIMLSWALYHILKPVNKPLAMLALFWRLAEGAIGLMVVLCSLIALRFLSGDAYLNVFAPQQLKAFTALFLKARSSAFDIVTVLVGLGGTVYCYLFFKSNLVPKILSVWGILAYVSLIAMGLSNILLPDTTFATVVLTVAAMVGSLFELMFGFWLLIKGVKNPQMI